MAAMIEFAKMISVLLGAVILGNWFLSEFKKTRLFYFFCSLKST